MNNIRSLREKREQNRKRYRPQGQLRILVPRVIDPETPALRPFIALAIDELQRKGQDVSPATVAAALTVPVALVEAQWPEGSN